MLCAMHRKIRRYLQIVVTEAWTVVWDDEAALPPARQPGSHVIEWDEGEAAPEVVVLRRRADGSGWQVETRDFWDAADAKRKSLPLEGD